jgi:hypothetical protein
MSGLAGSSLSVQEKSVTINAKIANGKIFFMGVKFG